MQPRLTFIGRIERTPSLATSKNTNQVYLQLRIKCDWEYFTGGNPIAKQGHYDIVFYKQKAEQYQNLKTGQLVIIDALVNGEDKTTQTGGHFLSYSFYGLSCELVKTGPVNGNVRETSKEDRHGLPDKPEYPSVKDLGFEDIPF